MATELDVLGIVSDRLSAQGLACMLTGSFAVAYYATPRIGVADLLEPLLA